MKKIIKTLLLLTLISYSINTSFAEPKECLSKQYCAVKDNTIKEIDSYIKDNTKALNNITSAVRNDPYKLDAAKGLSGLNNFLAGGMNKVVSWKGYNSYFSFYITSALTGDIPGPMYRDYQKLVNEGKRIENYMNAVSAKGYKDVELTKNQICAGVKGTCELEGRLSIVLVELYENNKNIKDLYRLATLGKEDEFYGTDDLFLIPNIDSTPQDTFIKTIKENYGANAVSSCSACEGGYFDKITTSINSIGLTLKGQSDGYQEWTDAWNLLIGNVEEDRKSKNERRLLKAELTKQGIKTKSADIILKNLDKYNKAGGYSWGNNLITNSFNTIMSKVRNETDEYSSTIDQMFEETLNDELTSDNSITVEDFDKVNSSVTISRQIDLDIKTLYATQLDLAQKDDMYNTSLIGRIIDTHINIGEATARLDKVIPIAEKTCDDQAKGLGQCSFKTF